MSVSHQHGKEMIGNSVLCGDSSTHSGELCGPRRYDWSPQHDRETDLGMEDRRLQPLGQKTQQSNEGQLSTRTLPSTGGAAFEGKLAASLSIVADVVECRTKDTKNKEQTNVKVVLRPVSGQLQLPRHQIISALLIWLTVKMEF